MGLARDFKTDPTVEKQGVVIDYGHTRIRIARAGGANKRYDKAIQKATKPFRRAIQSGTMDDDHAVSLMMETYAKTVILDWETRTSSEEVVPAEYAKGINPEDAGVPEQEELLPVTPENVMKVFKNLPDFFFDLKSQAEEIALFRKDIAEADAKNS